MDRSSIPHRRAIGLVVLAVLLGALLAYPATLDDLDAAGPEHDHHVAPSGTTAFEDGHSSVGGEDADLRRVQYGNLSPDARALFDRTLEQPRSETGLHEYRPRVCAPGVVGCPWRSDGALADELHYDSDRPASGAAIVVETDDGQYLYWTGGAESAGDRVRLLGELASLYWIALLLPAVAALLWLAGGRVGTGRRHTAAVAAVVAAVCLGLVSLLGLPVGAAVAAAVPAALPLLVDRRPPDRRVERLGIVLGVALAFVAVGPGYLAAYLGVDRPADLQFVALVGLSWVGGVGLLVLDWWLDPDWQTTPTPDGGRNRR